MHLDNYQSAAVRTAIYPGKGTWVGLVYTALGLGEAGELQGKVKKILRDDNFELTDDRRDAIAAELGDCLWYCAALATELGVSLSKIAEDNLAKLSDRAERNVLGGSGDER
jgi:NTP pyrophosphatase (non-canonical NTP hydrolase)